MKEFTKEEGDFLIKILKNNKTWYFHQSRTNYLPIFQEGYELSKSILEKIEGKEDNEDEDSVKNYSAIHPLIKKLGNK